jgi:hypothetical protein
LKFVLKPHINSDCETKLQHFCCSPSLNSTTNLRPASFESQLCGQLHKSLFPLLCCCWPGSKSPGSRFLLAPEIVRKELWVCWCCMYVCMCGAGYSRRLFWLCSGRRARAHTRACNDQSFRRQCQYINGLVYLACTRNFQLAHKRLCGGFWKARSHSFCVRSYCATHIMHNIFPISKKQSNTNLFVEVDVRGVIHFGLNEILAFPRRTATGCNFISWL